MGTLNNAQIKCIGCVAIYDYEIVDAEQKIWKGKAILDDSLRENRVMFEFLSRDAIYFSRKYDTVNSDVDRMLEEYEIKDDSLLGAKFLLVPKEKVLFAYSPPSAIIKPTIKIATR